jgi:hypothetical protein
MTSARRPDFRRKVFYIPGYDPFPARRYRELYRKEGARQAEISGYEIGMFPGERSDTWRVASLIDGRVTEADVEVLGWADIVRGSMRQGIARDLWADAPDGVDLPFHGDVPAALLAQQGADGGGGLSGGDAAAPAPCGGRGRLDRRRVSPRRCHGLSSAGSWGCRSRRRSSAGSAASTDVSTPTTSCTTTPSARGTAARRPLRSPRARRTSPHASPPLSSTTWTRCWS